MTAGWAAWDDDYWVPADDGPGAVVFEPEERLVRAYVQGGQPPIPPTPPEPPPVEWGAPYDDGRGPLALLFLMCILRGVARIGLGLWWWLTDPESLVVRHGTVADHDAWLRADERRRRRLRARRSWAGIVGVFLAAGTAWVWVSARSTGLFQFMEQSALALLTGTLAVLALVLVVGLRPWRGAAEMQPPHQRPTDVPPGWNTRGTGVPPSRPPSWPARAQLARPAEPWGHLPRQRPTPAPKERPRPTRAQLLGAVVSVFETGESWLWNAVIAERLGQLGGSWRGIDTGAVGSLLSEAGVTTRQIRRGSTNWRGCDLAAVEARLRQERNPRPER